MILGKKSEPQMEIEPTIRHGGSWVRIPPGARIFSRVSFDAKAYDVLLLLKTHLHGGWIIWKWNRWTIRLTWFVCLSVNFEGFWRWVFRLRRMISLYCENGQCLKLQNWFLFFLVINPARHSSTQTWKKYIPLAFQWKIIFYPYLDFYWMNITK